MKRYFGGISLVLFLFACVLGCGTAHAQIPDCTLAAIPSTVSPGQSVLLQGSCTNTDSTTSYSWSGPGTSVCTNSSSCTIKAPTSPGTYGYILTPINPTSGQGSGGNATLTVSGTPSCSLSASPSSVLPGATVQLQGLCSNLPQGTTFTWAGAGTGACPTTASDCTVIAPSTPGRTTYTLTANAPTQSTPPASATIDVLAGSCTLAATPPTPLPNGSVQLQGTCTNLPQGSSYVWSGPGTTGCSAGSPVCTLNAPGTAGPATYTLTATAAGGATAPASATINVVAPSCTLSATPIAPAPGAPVQLQGTCANVPQQSTYLWSGPGTTSCSTSSLACTVTAPGTAGPATYTLSASIAGATVITTTPASVTVNVQAPTCTLSATPANPLPNGAVQLQGTCANLPPGSTFSWTGPGTTSCTSSSPACAVTAPGTPGVATYTLTANSATGASTAAATATVNVGGNLDLVPVSGDKQSALPGQPLANPMIVRLVDGQGGPVSGVIVTWSDSNARDRLSVTSVATDGQGHASTVVTLSTDLGNRTITASAAGKSVTFTATAQIDLARAAVQLLAPMARSAVLSTRTQLDNVDQHLDDVHRTCNPGASGSAQAAVDGKRLGQVPWDGFVAGEINTNRQSTNAQQGGFKVSTNGITLGGDFSCTGNFVVGAAIGFFKGDITLDGGAGDQNAKGASVSGWGSFMPLPGAYFDFTAHYGRNDYDSRRASAAAATDLNSSTRGQQSAVAVKGGYQFKGEGPLQVDPYFRGEHIQADVNGFGEGGAADAIAVSDLKVKSTVSTFGGKLRYTFDTAHGEVTPHLRLELHRQSQESIDAVTARLVSAPDVMQTATLPQEDHNYGNFSLGASGTYDKHYEWYVNWEHLFGMQDVKGDSLTARFKYHF